MADGFKEVLESKSRRIRRWATRRHIEQDGYACAVWYADGPDPSYKKVLTLERYLGGKGSVYDPKDPTEAATDFNWDYYAPFEGEVWNHVFGELDWVDELIMSFGQADSSAITALIESVRMVPENLLGEPSWRDSTDLASLQHLEFTGDDSVKPLYAEILLESAMQELAYWTGATAQAYTDTFGPNGEYWSEICFNNYTLGEGVMAGAEAQLAIVAAARESVESICDKTIEALWHVNENETDNDAALLSIIGAIVTITVGVVTLGVAAPITAGAVVGLVGAVASSGVSAATGLNTASLEDSTAERNATISGDTAMDVLSAMRNELHNVKSHGNQEEFKLMAALYGAVTTATENRHLFEITFADDVPANDMGERSVSLETGDLEKAATVWFPQSAQRVMKATVDLKTSTGEDAAFKTDWDGGTSVAKLTWVALRELLCDLTVANGAKIRFAGDFLLEYAVEIGAVDSENASDVETAYEEIKDLPDIN